MLDDLDLAWEEQNDPRRQSRRGAPAGSRSHRRRRRKDKGGKKRSVTALLISVLLLGALGYGTWWGVGKIQDFFVAADYPTAGTGEVTIEIKEGESLTRIGNTLESAGVVKSAKAFINAAEADARSTRIEPGIYKVRREMRATDALGMLLDPKANRVTNGLTIPEGKTAKEVYKLLSAKTGIPVAEFEAAAKNPKALGVPDLYFKRDNSDGRTQIISVEGFLFPDTYTFRPDAKAADMLEAMVQRFMQVSEELDLPAVADSKSITPFEAITVASLVEKEAGVPEDMGKVARVVYNRLQPEWDDIDCGCLGFDSTLNYWRTLKGLPVKPSSQMTLAELKDPNNPYNTSSKIGLPPGPIANPGRAALEAALNPPQGNWYFFVLIDKNGRSAFAETNAQHEANKAIGRKNGVG